MNGSEIAYASLFALFCLGIIITTRQLLWGRLRRANLRKDLFHAKNSLIMLVAKGQLAKDDFVFQGLLSMTNVFINNTHRITLGQISAIALTEQERLETEQFAEQFIEKINAKDWPPADELKRVTISLFCTLRDLILDSSLSLRFFIAAGRFGLDIYKYLRPAVNIVIHLSRMRGQKEGYKAYCGFDQYVIQLRTV